MSDMIRIPIGPSGKPVAWALIDAEDYERIIIYRWYLSGRGYAFRTTKDNKSIFMHREVVDFPDSEDIHHRNENKLDNRRANLEPCTHKENVRASLVCQKNAVRRLFRAVVVIARLHEREQLPHRRYTYVRGCRCDVCRRAARDYQRSLRGKTPPRHGNSGYINFGCRCEICKRENSEYQRAARERQRERQAA